jgi:hypothetical protein
LFTDAVSELMLNHLCQWCACWLADRIWRALRLADFFGAPLPVSREDPDWGKILRVFVIYWLLSPGSEWLSIVIGLARRHSRIYSTSMPAPVRLQLRKTWRLRASRRCASRHA